MIPIATAHVQGFDAPDHGFAPRRPNPDGCCGGRRRSGRGGRAPRASASSHPDAVLCPTPGFPHGKCQGWAGGTGGGGSSVPMRGWFLGLRMSPVDLQIYPRVAALCPILRSIPRLPNPAPTPRGSPPLYRSQREGKTFSDWSRSLEEVLLRSKLRDRSLCYPMSRASAVKLRLRS